MTTVQEVKQLFDRKLNECRTLGLSEQFCRKKISNSNDPTLKDRLTILTEKKCLLRKTDKEDYDKCVNDVLEEAIGEEAVEERQWIPISTKFPTLKAVTDQDVDDFIHYRVINEQPTIHFGRIKTGSTGIRSIHPIKGNIIRDYLKKKDIITPDMSRFDQEEAVRKHYFDTYFKNYKVYDRDEVFKDSQILYEKLKTRIKVQEEITDEFELARTTRENTLFVTSPRGGYELLSIFGYANDLNKRAFPSDIREEIEHKEAEYKFQDKFEPVTIAIGNYTGMTWLGDKKQTIKRVIFIDDIIASGDQTIKAYKQFEKTFKMGRYSIVFPKATDRGSAQFDIPVHNPIRYYFGTLCKRDFPEDWEEARDEGKEEMVNDLEENSIGVHTTIGKKGFEKCLSIPPLPCDLGGKYISCAFAWAIPDGSSDHYIRELYKEAGRTTKNYDSRVISTPREGEKFRKIPEFRFYRSLDDFLPEEKRLFGKYLKSNDKFTGYRISYDWQPGGAVQHVWFHIPMNEVAKKEATKIIDDWVAGRKTSTEEGFSISNLHQTPYAIQTWTEGFLKDFGYKRDNRGLLKRIRTEDWEPIEPTLDNKLLIQVFQPIMKDPKLTTNEKQLAADIATRIRDSPEIITKILAGKVSVWDYSDYKE